MFKFITRNHVGDWYTLRNKDNIPLQGTLDMLTVVRPALEAEFGKKLFIVPYPTLIVDGRLLMGESDGKEVN